MADELTGNGRLLAAIDERTKRMDTKMDGYHEDLCKRLDDHETRIRSLEASKPWSRIADAGAYVMGLGAMIKSFLAG